MTHLDKVTEHIRKLMLESTDHVVIEKLAHSLEALSRVNRNDVETMQQLEYLTQSRQAKASMGSTGYAWNNSATTFHNQV